MTTTNEPTDDERRPAEVFRPGEYVRDELIARGWTVDDLSNQSGLMRDTLESLIREDHEPMTHEIAEGLSKAFGTTAHASRSQPPTRSGAEKEAERQATRSPQQSPPRSSCRARVSGG